MTLAGLVVAADDRVRATAVLVAQERVGTTDRFDIQAGDTFTVTRVYRDRLQVRSDRLYNVRETYGQWSRHRMVDKQISFILDRAWLVFADADYVPPPEPRKLGTKPDDTDEMTYIGIDHPGIQWLFDDMGQYATEKRYCNEYDALCVRLGIPGRPRDFSVTHKVGPFTMTTTVKARSQAEANRMVREALAKQSQDEGETTSAPVPDLTPAA